MSRTLSSEIVTMLGEGQLHTAHLVEATTTGGTVYLTDAQAPIDYNGNTYLAAGWMLGFSGVEEFSGVQIGSITLSLSGVDQTQISNFMNNDYLDQFVTIRKAFLHHVTGGLVGTPPTLFVGRIDGASIQEDPDGGTCTLAVSASSHWVDFHRRTGRHTNAGEHHQLFNNNMGMDWAHENDPIYWGPKREER